jgi:hypothetical protein
VVYVHEGQSFASGRCFGRPPDSLALSMENHNARPQVCSRTSLALPCLARQHLSLARTAIVGTLSGGYIGALQQIRACFARACAVSSVADQSHFRDSASNGGLRHSGSSSASLGDKRLPGDDRLDELNRCDLLWMPLLPVYSAVGSHNMLGKGG